MRQSRTARTRAVQSDRRRVRAIRNSERALDVAGLELENSGDKLIVVVGKDTIEVRPQPRATRSLRLLILTTGKGSKGVKALTQIRKALVASGLQVSV